MLDAISRYLHNRTGLQLVRDAVDLLLVYYICYRALLVVRGTRAMQIGLGLGLIFLLYVVAQFFDLISVLTLTGTLIQSTILVIVVVFQNDIRRGLQRVGSQAWFGSFARAQESRVIDAVVEAATELARHRIGAIIAFEQDANLDEFVGAHKGHLIDAHVSAKLLVALFVPESVNKLHDGALIIRNLRIAKGGVFFPMPEARVVDDSFGSRHRAALGITEETDAVVVVVSEERGTISFCFNGNIASNLDGPKLRTMLEAIFRPKVRKRSRQLAAPTRRPEAVAAQRGREAPEELDAQPSEAARTDGRVSELPGRRPSEAPPPLRTSGRGFKPKPLRTPAVETRPDPDTQRAEAPGSERAEPRKGGADVP